MSRRLSYLLAAAVFFPAAVAFAQTPSTSTSASTPPPAASASTSSSAAKPSPTATASDVAAGVQKVYDGITAYEADFSQQYVMKAFGTKKESKGHVVFVKPGKMRWDYSDPKDNVVVSNGTLLQSYVAADKQVRKMQVKDSQMPTALAFLTGKGNLASDFDLKLLDATKYKFDGGYVLEARPKTATNLYSFVLFYVDAATYQVRRVLIVDGQDNRNRFDFDKPTVNGKVDGSRFEWKAPAGTTETTN